MNDQHVIAVATIVQDVLLLLSAGLIAWYLWETRKLRKAAYEQLTAMRQQTAVAQDQLEGQIQPAVVARMTQMGVQLVNIGTGPALHVKLGSVAKSSVNPADVIALQQDRIGFIEARQTRQTVIRVFAAPNQPGATLLNNRNLWCEYRSLSGRVHVTIVAFAGDDGADDTRFYQLTTPTGCF